MHTALQSGCLKAYVSALCNFAELYECTGQLTPKEEYISSALAALQAYKGNLPTNMQQAFSKAHVSIADAMVVNMCVPHLWFCVRIQYQAVRYNNTPANALLSFY